MQRTKPTVIGIYKGLHKPHDPNIFFEKFVADIIRIMSSGGITYCGNKILIRLRSFIHQPELSFSIIAVMCPANLVLSAKFPVYIRKVVLSSVVLIMLFELMKNILDA